MLAGVVLIYLICTSASILLRTKRTIIAGIDNHAQKAKVTVERVSVAKSATPPPVHENKTYESDGGAGARVLAAEAAHPKLARLVERYVVGLEADGLYNAAILVESSLAPWLKFLNNRTTTNPGMGNHSGGGRLAPSSSSLITLSESVVEQLPKQQHPLRALQTRRNRAIKVVTLELAYACMYWRTRP